LWGEICPLLVPVLPALEYWLLPVPGPPGWFRILSSGFSVFDPGMLDPLCCADDWLPLVWDELPDWVSRFICCCELLPDWLVRFPEVLPRSLSLAIGLLLGAAAPALRTRTQATATWRGMPL
jgi:hypothetical protein